MSARDSEFFDGGWCWMSHPSHNDGNAIPVFMREVNGDRFYFPCSPEDVGELWWDERDSEWEMIVPPLASSLVDAAPDMLAALQEAVALADANLPNFDGVRTPACQACYDKCVAAIAQGNREHRMNCIVCESELAFRWTDTHGVGVCGCCGTPYTIYHYDGDKRVDKTPEPALSDKGLEVAKRYWAEKRRMVFPGAYDMGILHGRSHSYFGRDSGRHGRLR